MPFLETLGYRSLVSVPTTSQRRPLMASKILALGAASLISISGLSHANNGSAQAGAVTNQTPITSLADFNRIVSQDRTVTRRATTFKNGQIDMAGVLFTPADMEQGKTYPAIVVV